MDKHLHRDEKKQQYLPVGAGVVDASRIGKESQHNAPQDHIRVSWKNKTITSDTTLDFTSTHCKMNSKHSSQSQSRGGAGGGGEKRRRRRKSADISTGLRWPGDAGEAYAPSLDVQGTLNLVRSLLSCSLMVVALSRPL